jgi:hypothetical protein
MESGQSTPSSSGSTLQDQLFAAIKQAFPDAEAKKINKDNFLDIYIPSISAGRGTHLFFNTVKGAIKIGYYTRDEEFITKVAASSPQLIEAASNGLRILENPKYEDLEAAVAAALEFLASILGEGVAQPQTNAEEVSSSASTDSEMSDDEIDFFLSENGVDFLAGILENYLVEDELVVLTIEKEDLIASIKGTCDIGDCLQPLESVGLNDWAGLANLVGKKEANWAKKEFKDENASGIVLLYCNGKYVYAFSNPQEEDSSEEEDNSWMDSFQFETNENIRLDQDSILEILEVLNSDKNLSQISITYYTQSYSDLNYSLTYKVKKATIEVNRVNWFNDSYWTGKIDRKELIKGLKSFLKGSIDATELVNDYFSRDLIDYEFNGAGNFDNGLELEITDLGDLTEVPENLQDEDGNLDAFALSNNVVVQEEDLYDTNVGEAYSYQLTINDKTYELVVADSEEDSSSEEEEIFVGWEDSETEEEDVEDDEDGEEEDEDAEGDAEEEGEDIIRNTHPVSHYSDLEKLIKIIKEDSNQIHFVHESILKEEAKLEVLLVANPEIFSLLPEKYRSSKSIKRFAIEIGYYDSSLLELIDLSDKNLLRKVMIANSNYYNDLPDEYKTKELICIAVENQSGDITFDSLPESIQTDPTFFKELMDYLHSHLSYKPIPSYSYSDCLIEGYQEFISEDAALLIKNGLLDYASPRLLKDEAFCFNYLKENIGSYGELLEKNDNLAENEAFARLAVELDGANNYPNLPDQFQHDRAFLDRALKSADGTLMLNQLPDEVIHVDGRIDFDLVERLLLANPFNLKTISVDIMEGEGVSERLVFAAKNKNNVLYYAPDSLKKDKAFLSKLMDANPYTITFADKSILADREFMRGILSKLPIAIKFCSEELKSDKQLVKEVVSLNGLVIRYLDAKIVSDPEIYWTALRQNPEAFTLLPSEIYSDTAVQEYVSKINGGIFKQFSTSSYPKQIKFNAILNSADGAFEDEVKVFKSLGEKDSQEEILEAIKLDPTQVVFLPQDFFSKNVNVTRSILEVTSYPLRFKTCRKALGEQELKNQLRDHSWAFKYLEEDEAFSDEFVKEVLALNGNLLQYLTADQKKDITFIRIALNANPEACYFVSKEYDWKSEESQALARQILTIDPHLFTYFIERDPEPIYEFFQHAFNLDASVLEMMDHSYFEDPWYFISENNGSFPLFEDALLYGLNQNGQIYYWEPISNTPNNVCLAIENGVEFGWEDLFTTWKHDLTILHKAFTCYPSEETFQALKKKLGKKFEEATYITPQLVAKGSELYPLLSTKLQQDRSYAFAYLKSDDFYDLSTKFENLPSTFKKDDTFLKMLLGIKIDFEVLDAFFDSKTLHDESFILPYLELNFDQYTYFPDKLQKNRAIALQYGICNSEQAYFGLTDLGLPEKWSTDKGLILEIAKGNKFKNFRIDEALLNDSKFLLELIEFQPQLVQALEEDHRNPDLFYKLMERNQDVFDYLEVEEKFNSKLFNLMVAKDTSKIRKIEWSYTLSDAFVELTKDLNITRYINLFEESDFAEALSEKHTIKSVALNDQSEKKNFVSTQYYFSEPGTVTLGYDRNCYLCEAVAGEISDEMILEFLEGEDGWSDFIWYNSWHDYASIYHTYGMGEPASDMQLPSGKIIEVKLTYDAPVVDNIQESFNCSEKGSFVQIASSEEKAYGWGKWRTYSLEVGAGVFDVANISVQFEGDIVESYHYNLPDGTYESFEENQDYETTGQGFSSTLHFNNGKELLDVDDLRDLLEENGVDLSDIKAIKKFLLQYSPE